MIKVSKKYFNKKAPEWDLHIEHNSDKIRSVITSLEDISNPYIMDVGTGTGVLIPFLKEKYPSGKIKALDYAEKMIEIAESRYGDYSGVEFIHGDVYNFNFSQSFFDLIICYSVFPHLIDSRDIIARFYKLLKENGQLLIFHSQSREAINAVHNKIKDEEGTVSLHRKDLPPADVLVEMGEKAGFRTLDSKDDSEIYLLKFIK